MRTPTPKSLPSNCVMSAQVGSSQSKVTHCDWLMSPTRSYISNISTWDLQWFTAPAKIFMSSFHCHVACDQTCRHQCEDLGFLPNEATSHLLTASKLMKRAPAAKCTVWRTVNTIPAACHINRINISRVVRRWGLSQRLLGEASRKNPQVGRSCGFRISSLPRCFSWRMNGFQVPVEATLWSACCSQLCVSCNEMQAMKSVNDPASICIGCIRMFQVLPENGRGDISF